MLLSELKFGSYLTYTPRPNSDEGKYAKNYVNSIKMEIGIPTDPPLFMSDRVAKNIKAGIDETPLKDFFGRDVALVPVPKSSLMQLNSLWVPLKLATAFSKEGFGTCYPCLERKNPVNKASYSKPENRPKAIDHYKSIKLKMTLQKPKKIILIDDVVTRGSTLLGCASLLQESFPGTPIIGFAVVRTISDPDNFKKMVEPCIGKITRNGDDTFRVP